MKKIVIGLGISLMSCLGCSSIFGKVTVKQYYVLNYVTDASSAGTIVRAPYPFTIRIKDFDIEEAYARPQIVYRQNPFELLYYGSKLWAVKPNRMVTDLVRKQMISSGLVSHIVRRYDEGLTPDFELSGLVEAIEEYDSDQLWFAHIAIRFTLTRVSDGSVVYTKVFDNRKRVFTYSPDNVVREMSAIVEFIMNQAIRDFDEVFSRENNNGDVVGPEKGKNQGAGGE